MSSLKKSSVLVKVITLSFLLGLILSVPGWLEAQQSGKGSAAYTTIDLPGPYHTIDGGVSRAYAEKVADTLPQTDTLVLGYFDRNGQNDPCLWRINAARVVTAVDLANHLDQARNLNSVGIIGGAKNDRPVLVFPNGTTLFLADATYHGVVSGLSNPDSQGIFYAVGNQYIPNGSGWGMRWTLNVQGQVLAVTVLADSNGFPFIPMDINDNQLMCGNCVAPGSPAQVSLGMLDLQGNVQISTLANPNPQEITSFGELQLDSGGNVVAYGRKPLSLGYHARAVVWPSNGAAIDLSAQFRIDSTEGNDIAVVNGEMQVVGRAESSGKGPYAYLFTKGKMNNLGSLSKGAQPWTFDRAEGVNAQGLICGVGKVGSRTNQQWHGFLLIPNP